MNGHRQDHIDFSAKMLIICCAMTAVIGVGAVADTRMNGGRVLAAIDGSPGAWQAMTKSLPGRAGQPDVVVLLREAKDGSMLCAQRADTDQMDCRPVGEARKWLRERPAVKR